MNFTDQQSEIIRKYLLRSNPDEGDAEVVWEIIFMIEQTKKEAPKRRDG